MHLVLPFFVDSLCIIGHYQQRLNNLFSSPHFLRVSLWKESTTKAIGEKNYPYFQQWKKIMVTANSKNKDEKWGQHHCIFKYLVNNLTIILISSCQEIFVPCRLRQLCKALDRHPVWKKISFWILNFIFSTFLWYNNRTKFFLPLLVRVLADLGCSFPVLGTKRKSLN